MYITKKRLYLQLFFEIIKYGMKYFKKLFLLILIILSFCSINPIFAIEEPVYLPDLHSENNEEIHHTILEKTEQENKEDFSPIILFDENNFPKDMEKSSIKGEIQQQVLNKEEEQQDLKSEKEKQKFYANVDYNALEYAEPLLQEHLTFKLEKGFIKSINPYFAFQGIMSSNFANDDYYTKYEQNTAELGFLGELKELPVQYRIVFNFMPDKKHNFFQTMFKDDFIIINAIPHNSIYLGSFRTPIGMEGGTSGYTIPFIRRSQIARHFGSVRGVGTKILGDYKLIQYNLGVTSSDRNFEHFLPGLEFNGLVSLKPLGKTDGRYGTLKIGGSINAGHRNFDYLVTGAHLSYKYKRAELDAEYAIADGSNGLSGLTRNKASGFNITMSYYLTEKLQALARYDYFNNNRMKSGMHDTEYTAGLNYYVKGSSLKFMLNYIYAHSEYSKSSHRILLGTQVIF